MGMIFGHKRDAARSRRAYEIDEYVFSPLLSGQGGQGAIGRVFPSQSVPPLLPQPFSVRIRKKNTWFTAGSPMCVDIVSTPSSVSTQVAKFTKSLATVDITVS